MINEVHESWKPLFFNAIEKDLFREIDMLDYNSVYPTKEDVFRVFETPLNEIKVVILGQDPYFNPNQAVGLAFAVPHKSAKPPSLKNIEREVGHEINRTLIPWIEQGVFLLNTALTASKGKPGSHIELWKPFTTKVVQYISQNQPCIWLLWGKHAQSYIDYIDNYVYEYRKEDEKEKNVVLIASHPASESYRENAGFFGCNHFTKVNSILVKADQKSINW